MLQHIVSTRAGVYSLGHVVDEIKDSIKVTNRALGRAIAKIDPLYGVPEDDPARKAASDKLSDEIIKRMTGEVKASDWS